jgi:dynein heavy chain
MHRYYVELKRHNYVTPTSYLELITCFKSLYDMKIEKITMQRNRYEVGLEKLDFAAGQVCSSSNFSFCILAFVPCILCY